MLNLSKLRTDESGNGLAEWMIILFVVLVVALIVGPPIIEFITDAFSSFSDNIDTDGN